VIKDSSSIRNAATLRALSQLARIGNVALATVSAYISEPK
jgi:hypothetical protein